MQKGAQGARARRFGAARRTLAREHHSATGEQMTGGSGGLCEHSRWWAQSGLGFLPQGAELIRCPVIQRAVRPYCIKVIAPLVQLGAYIVL
ncbi:MAG TPA: hypothetical protein VGG97_00505 [Bryobacteraceae bacterium]